MSPHTSIRLESAGDTATITLTPPAGKPPTLDHASLSQLEAAVTELEARPPRAVVLRSNEVRYFCVGANLAVVEHLDGDTIVPWVMLGHGVLNRMEDLPCPVIAAVSGFAFGGGLELALACDLIVVDPTVKLAQSEASLGLIPGWGGTLRLAERIGNARAKRMFFTGETLDGATALAWGLADVLAPEGGLNQAVDGVIAGIRKNSGPALATFKRIVNTERAGARDRCAALEAQESRKTLQHADAKKRIADFFSSRRK